MLSEFTSNFWWTAEKAQELANTISRGGDILGDPSLYAYLKNQYVTSIKGPPFSEALPDECWAITNKFDPRVCACNKSS